MGEELDETRVEATIEDEMDASEAFVAASAPESERVMSHLSE